MALPRAHVRDVALWNLYSAEHTSASEIARNGERIVTPGAQYLLPLTTNVHIKENPRTIEHMFLPDETGVMARALLMGLLRTAHAYTTRITAKLRGDMPTDEQEQHRGAPVRMYLETVTIDPRRAKRVRFDVEPVHVDFQRTGDTPEALAVALESAIRKTSTNDPNSRDFMRGVDEMVPTYQLRFWFSFMYPLDVLDPAELFHDLIKTAIRSFADYVGMGPKSRYGSSSSSSSSSHASLTASGVPDDTKYGHSVSGVDSWLLLRSYGTLAAAFDSLHGDTMATSEDNLRQINDPRTPFVDNPVHPRFTLSPEFLLSRASHLLRPSVRSIDSYYNKATDTWSFALPDHVVRVAPQDMYPSRIFVRVLPRFQIECVQKRGALASARVRRYEDDDDDDDDDDDENENEDVRGTRHTLDPTLLRREPHQMTNMNDAVDYRGFANPNRSNLHRMYCEVEHVQREFQRLISSVDEHGRQLLTRREIRALYLDMQRRQTATYVEQCTSTDAYMSPPSIAINQWYESHRDVNGKYRTHTQYTPLMDRRLSIFGDMVARQFFALETAMHVAHTHRIIHVCILAAFGASRFKYSLRPHVFMYGPHSGSKTFCGRFILTSLIPGTTMAVNGTTENTFTGDDDWTKTVCFYDETPVRIMAPGKDDKNDAGERVFKTMLTEGHYTKPLMNHDSKAPGGTARHMIKFDTDLQTTWLFACNHPLYKVSQPMQSRLFLAAFVRVIRQGREPEAFANVQQLMTSRGHRNAKVFVDHVRDRQALQNTVEDLITVGALTEPTLACMDVMKPIFARVMRDRFLINIETRAFEQMLAFVRVLVIQRALRIMYDLPSSRFYNKPFEYDQLKMIDPFLRDDPEIIAYVFQMFRDQCLGVSDRNLQKKISALYMQGVHGVHAVDELLYTRDTLLFPSGADAFRQPLAAKRPRLANVNRSAPQPIEDPRELRDDDNNNNGARETYTPKREDCYYAYYNTKRSVWELALLLEKQFQTEDWQLKASEISSYLKNMCSSSFMGHRFELATVDDRRLAAEQDEPGDKKMFGYVRPRRRHGRSVMSPMFIECDRVFVHLEYLLEERNPIEEAIQACFGKHEDDTRMFLSATQVSVQHPYLLRTYYPAAKSDLTIRFRNVAVSTNVLAAAAFPRTPAEIVANDVYDPEAGVYDETGTISINESLETYATRKRAQALFLDEEIDGASGGTCDIHAANLWARANYVGQEIKAYPHGYLMPYEDRTGKIVKS